MNALKTLTLGLAVAAATSVLAPQRAEAGFYHRQYYDNTWTYSPTYSYYYVRYYYQPVVTVPTYSYHYCIYYPSRPRYIYYYNPVTQAYWGRYEIGSKEGQQYSLLADKDRKKDLKAIPEDAFPKPASMPKMPEAKDGETMLPPPENVPQGDTPKDAPAGGK